MSDFHRCTLLMSDATKNQEVCELYTEGSHHRNLSVICLLQNLYYQGKQNRTMNLNTQYLVLFKNPRDQQQMSILGRQMYPNNFQYFMKKFQEATKRPYGYLLVDLKQETLETQRLCTNVLDTKTIYNTTNLNTPQCSFESPSDYIKEMEKMPSCMDCGLCFATSPDLQLHAKRGCPEASDEDNYQTARKRSKIDNRDDDSSDDESSDESVWDYLKANAYADTNKKFITLIDKYIEDGLSEKQARQKARQDLFDRNVKCLMKLYRDGYKISQLLERSTIHADIVKEKDKLIKTKDYDDEEALKCAVKKYKREFKDMIHLDETDSEDSEKSQESSDYSEETEDSEKD